MFLPEPRGLGSAERVEERQDMLANEVGVQPLRGWAREVASRRNALVPQIDPAEGGVSARVLMLFESPGPVTDRRRARRRGSGFISIDNDDATAEAVWRARLAADLHHAAMPWNIVPWYLGEVRRPRRIEVAEGARELPGLLSLLPRLEVIVLGGLVARDGWHSHIPPEVAARYVVIDTWHPSPLSLNQEGRRAAFNEAVLRAAQSLSPESRAVVGRSRA